MRPDGDGAGIGESGLLVRVLAYTGLCWGEAAALRVRRVDLLRRRIEVVESVTEVGGQAVTGTPKNPPTPVDAARPFAGRADDPAARRQGS
jgi:integrase